MSQHHLQLIVNPLFLLDLPKHFIHGIRLVNIAKLDTCGQYFGKHGILGDILEVIGHFLLIEYLQWLNECLKQFSSPLLRILLRRRMLFQHFKSCYVLGRKVPLRTRTVNAQENVLKFVNMVIEGKQNVVDDLLF